MDGNASLSVKSFALGFLSALLLLSVAGYTSDSPTSKEDPYRPLETFAQALSYIENEYVEPVGRRELIYRAIEGMVERLDLFSSFIRPERYRKFKHWTQGELGSPGVRVERGKRGVTISHIYPNSPAERAKLSEGDLILEIDGKPLDKMKLEEIRELLLGPLGSRIKLKVLKKNGKTVSVELTRAKVWEQNIQTKVLKGKIFYIKLSFFQDYTAQKLLQILSQRREKNIPTEGIALDLRDNPGGLFKQGVKVADLFLDKGVIVTVKGKKPQFTERESAHPKGTWRKVPLAVLINSKTASAAEIVAAALKEHRRAVLVGERTYGKGSIQSLVELNDGSALKLTVAHYYSPMGRKIDGNGVSPHISITSRLALKTALKVLGDKNLYQNILQKPRR